jgi:hypothetical protein
MPLRPILPYKIVPIRFDRIALIVITTEFKTYKEAYHECIEAMKKDTTVMAVLIYSQNTATVIKRKWADNAK